MLQFVKGEFKQAKANGTVGELAKVADKNPRDDEAMAKLGYSRQGLYGTCSLFTRRTPERTQRVIWCPYLPAAYTEDESDFMELMLKLGLAQRLLQL